MYYLLLNNTQAGPFTLAQLADQWQAKQVTPLTLYWEQGNADWLPLHNIAGLLEAPGASSLPRPPSLPTVPTPQPSVPDFRAAPAPVQATRGAEEVVWSGHPSLWDWIGSIIWGILLTPVLIGIFILIYVFWKRSRTNYQITNHRVSVETGLFNRSSRELRIEDIRSIAAQANIFGIGDVAFSTAARAEAEVVFYGVSHVERVRDIIKQLQNNLR